MKSTDLRIFNLDEAKNGSKFCYLETQEIKGILLTEINDEHGKNFVVLWTRDDDTQFIEQYRMFYMERAFYMTED